MGISELTSYTTKDVQDIDALMHELSVGSFCDEQRLRAVVEDRNSHLYVVRDSDGIVGSACLCVAHTTEFVLGFVESVVILNRCRGQHLGRQLMEHIIAEARRLGIDSLHLTSNPRRVAANALYQSLGFEHYDTNVYRFDKEVKKK